MRRSNMTCRSVPMPNRRDALRAGAVLMLPGAAAAEPATVSVQVDTARVGHRIPPGLFGANLQWPHGGDGAWAGSGVDPELLQILVGSRLGGLRFPGGDLANTYRWKNGIGARAGRGAGQDFNGQATPSDFGSDEFLALCRQARLSPSVVTVNPNAEPAEAADWVEYLNGAATTPWGARRAAGGHAEPAGVRWWEVGNESFDPHQPGFVGARDYARRFLAFAAAMKARDPAARIGLVLEATFLQAAWMPRLMPHMPTWNDEVLAIAGAQADFGVVHFYAPHDKTSRDDALHRAVMAGSEVFAANLARVRQSLASHGRAGLPLVVSEYGLWFGDKVRPDPRIAGADNALFAASLLLAMAGMPDIVAAQAWSLLNNSSFGALSHDDGRWHRRPLFDALSLLAEFGGSRWVPVAAEGPTFSTPAFGNLPALARVPVLCAGAALADDGALRIALVNRSPGESLRVDLAGGPAAARRWVAGRAWAADWRTDKAEGLPQTGGRRQLDLPPASLVMIGPFIPDKTGKTGKTAKGPA
jgi:alpha-N-arabinofuranosidase